MQVNILEKKPQYLGGYFVYTITVKGSLIMMTGPVRAEQNTAICLAASSGLDNTERNVRDKDNTTLTRSKGNQKGYQNHGAHT